MTINVPKWEDISTGSGWTFRCLVPILKSTACVACVLSTVLCVAIVVGMAGLLVLIPITLDITMLTACPKFVCRSLGSLCFVPMWVQWTFFQSIIAMETSSLLLGANCILKRILLRGRKRCMSSGSNHTGVIKKQICLKLW